MEPQLKATFKGQVRGTRQAGVETFVREAAEHAGVTLRKCSTSKGLVSAITSFTVEGDQAAVDMFKQTVTAAEITI